jgi:pyruvate dehydrogenase E1 component beta subunit
MSVLSYREAVYAAQAEEMRRDPAVFVMGEDLAAGVYGPGIEEFGSARVRNTPISEAGFVGAAVGAALTGLRPIAHVGNAAFLYGAMDQIVSQVAKNRYMFGAQAAVPLVVRLSLSYGGSSAAHHSDRPYPMLMNVPGLKIVLPSTPADAKGLLKAAIREDDPVMFFEDNTLAGTKGEVDDDIDTIVELGRACVCTPGTDVTVVAVASAVREAMSAAEDALDEGVSVEVIDLRSLVPLDRATVLASVAKTGRLIVADLANRTCGLAAEVSAIVAEEGFGSLVAPILRVTTPDVPVPFSPALERPLYPNRHRILGAIRAVVDARPGHRRAEVGG